MKTTLIIVVAMAVCACAGIAPPHEIPVKPDHINAGVQAGDTVEITTKDGETRKFVVKEVGCSNPEVVLLMSEDYKDQAEKFHPACVTHDFCYRHGFATYGAKYYKTTGGSYCEYRDGP